MKTKWTAERIKGLKGNAKVACLTAYDFTTARHLDAAGLHMALVGDSLANTMLGYSTTLPVTLEQIGLGGLEPEMLERIAVRSTAPGETIHNEPFAVSAAMVADAIRAADAMGRASR